jgi:hypothetical protein
MAPRKKPEPTDGDKPESPSTSLAVEKEIANKIRAAAKESGATTYEITNQLLDYALKNATIRVQVKYTTIEPKRK